jgi:hypothetical protein
MGRIIELPQTIDIDEIVAKKGVGYKPDLRIYTAGIEPDRENKRLVHMIGSSTQRDMQGDVMSLLALNDMTKAVQNMTIWLNHNYDLPDSIFGSVLGSPRIAHQDGIADLQLSVDVEMDNPSAARVKRYIDNGRKLGCSIGCMVTKYEVPDESDGEGWQDGGIIIHGVYVVEYSVVGIPCNQRSWVENAIRGVFTRTLDPNLAPAMKSLWPSRYQEILKSLPDQQRRSIVDALPARSRQGDRVEWNALNKSFTLYRADAKKELQPAEMKEWLLLEEQNPGHPAYSVVEEAEELIGALSIPDMAVEELDSSPEEQMNKIRKSIPSDEVVQPEPVPEKTPTTVEEPAPEAISEEQPSSGDAPEEEELPVAEVIEELPKEKEVAAPEVVKEALVVDEELSAPILAMLTAYNVVGKQLGLPEVTKSHFQASQHPALETKAAPELHPSHLMKCMAIHSLVHEMTDGACCTNQDGEDFHEATEQAREASGESPSAGYSVAYALGDKADLLMKSVERYNASLADVVDLKKEAELTRKELDAARTEMLTIGAEIVKAQETLASIKDMPLGNPVKHSRTVHEEDNVAKREDFLHLKESEHPVEQKATDNLITAFSLTEVKAVAMDNGQFMRYRVWPEGVGGSIAKGVRPALTSDQISYMDFNDIRAYREGKAAKVPYLGSQVANGHGRDTK